MSAYCSKQQEGLRVFAILIKKGHFWTRFIPRKKVKGAGVSVASIMYMAAQPPRHSVSARSQKAAASQAFLRELPVADERPVSWSGRYLSQQMSHVTTTENMARMLATDRQMGPAGEGGML